LRKASSVPLRVERRLPVGPPEAVEAQPTVLPIAAVRQEQANWCWATVVQMVEKFNGIDVRQCDLAIHEFGLRCCDAPLPVGCDRALSDPDITALWGHQGYAHVVYVFSQVTVAVVRGEIRARRPVEIGVSWHGGGGHVILVVGIWWDPASVWVYVNDPGEAKTVSVTWARLRTAYGHGVWDATWTGLHK
jgi:hypothetical protein